jgi:hypothetical protein
VSAQAPVHVLPWRGRRPSRGPLPIPRILMHRSPKRGLDHLECAEARPRRQTRPDARLVPMPNNTVRS